MGRLALTVIILFCSMISNAQIRGYLLDENSTPLSGAVIILLNKTDSTLIASTASGDKGFFSFSQKANGEELLSISMLGYANLAIPAKAEMGNITITAKALELETVTVRGAAFTASSDRFTFAISNPALIAGNDAVGILKLTPLLQAGDGGVSIIGKGATKVYVNGREVKLNGISLASYLKSIPAEDIVKVEVMPVANSTFKGQGDFGVVNLILRKRETNGVKGSLSLTDIQAHYNRQYVNFNLSGRKNKFGIDSYIWGSHVPSYYTEYDDTRFIENGNTVSSENISRYTWNTIGAWVGIDYDISKNQTIGFVVNGELSDGNHQENNTSIYGNIGSPVIDSTYQTDIDIKRRINNLNVNLNYQIKTDTLGSVFTVDVDYINHPTSETRWTTFNKIDDNGNIDYSSTLNQSTPMAINIWSGKAMYEHYFKKYGNLSVGIDNYTTNYDSDYTSNDPINSQNNQFLFTEAISGAFASYSNRWTKKFSTTVGFRIENTYNKGEQVGSDEKFSNNKTRILPTAYINYNINQNHNLSYSLSNRITQPPYYNINPIVRYTSPTSYRVGNPYLESSSNLIQNLTYMYKNRLMVKASVILCNNVAGAFVIPDGENGTKMITMNYGNNNSYGLTLGFFGNYFDGIWQANNYVYMTYNTWAGGVDDIIIDKESYELSLNLNNDFTLSKIHQIIFSISFGYRLGGGNETSKYAPIPQLHLGLRKTFKDFTIALYSQDILRTAYDKVTYNSQGILRTGKYYWDTQSISLRLTYNFGNMKTKGNRSRQTSSSAAEKRL